MLRTNKPARKRQAGRFLRRLGIVGLFLALSTTTWAANDADFDGEKISLDVQQADILTILRTISNLSGENIVPGPSVKGDVTVRMIDVPWPSALDVVLRAHGYGWKRDRAGIIRVTTIINLQNEDLEKEAAERKKEDLLPIVTRIVTCDFAKASELEVAIQSVLSKRGEVQVDDNTNSLIVSDIEMRVARVEELITSLDQVTQQVQIVTKLIDVDAKVSQELGIEWLASGLNVEDADGVFTGEVGAPIATPVGKFGVFTTGPGGELDATLQALATTNQAEIISNPRITTLDNHEAQIHVGKKIPLIVSDPSGNPITELTSIGIMLKVTPHVHSNGRVTLELNPEVSDLSSQATVQGGIIIVTSQASTRVMVESGQTAVIGGLVRKNVSETESGVPLLKDIPFFGHFFKSSNNTEENRELLIFVTPTILEVGDLSQADETSEALGQ